MTERPPHSPTRAPLSASAPSSPLRSPRQVLLPRLPRETSPRPGPSQQNDPQVRETGLIAWIESIREDLRRENEAFREKMIRENEVWKAGVLRELREEVRRLVVEKFLADHKPSSSSDTSSLYLSEDPTTSYQPPAPARSGEPSPISPLTPIVLSVPGAESLSAGTSSMLPPTLPSLPRQTPQAGPSTSRRTQKLPTPVHLHSFSPRKPRIGSYYAAIVDTRWGRPRWRSPSPHDRNCYFSSRILVLPYRNS